MDERRRRRRDGRQASREPGSERPAVAKLTGYRTQLVATAGYARLRLMAVGRARLVASTRERCVVYASYSGSRTAQDKGGLRVRGL